MRSSALDHLVLPTADLAVARARLTALGFTVAPDGVHPFGTANCCIYFSDGTFIEPLAIANETAANQAIAEQNIFVERDRLFRSIMGQEGLSAVVLTTDDAQADHEEFVRVGISGGPMLEFSRPFVDASGQSDEAVFRLAFGAESHARACFFFTCQQVRAPNVDRRALQQHTNTVVRPRATFWSADELPEKMRFWRDFLGLPPVIADPGRLLFMGQRGWYWVQNEQHLWAEHGIEPDYCNLGMRGRAVEFECKDIGATQRLLEANAVTHQLRGSAIIVPPAPGQGITFIFGNQT